MAHKGKKPLKLKPKQFEDSVPYLDIEAVEKKNILQYADKNSTVLATEADIFVVWDGSRSGLVANGMVGAVGSTIMRLTPILINKDYLFHFLQLNYSDIRANTVGGSIPHVNPSYFYNILVPTPPLAEQKRIVEVLKVKLDEYQRDFDIAKSELAKIAEYRKSVFEETILGGLTEEWRQENSNGKKLNFQDEYLKIPNNWTCDLMKNICYYITDGDHQSPKKVKLGIPFIVISNIKNGVINFSNASYVSKEYYENLQDYRKPQKNDILLSVVGTLGNAALVTDDINFCFQRHIALIRCNNELVIPNYLYIVMQSEFFYKQILAYAKGNAQLTLNLSSLRDLLVPIPPIIEQQEIVYIVQKLLVQFNDIESKYSKSIERTENLRQSVFQMAFKGQLSHSEPNDEPVLILLEKVKTEKERSEKEQKEIQKSKTRSKMDKKNDEPTISEILKKAENNTLTGEELWAETVFSKTHDVEPYYEELLALKDAKKIKIAFADARNIQTNITLLEDAH